MAPRRRRFAPIIRRLTPVSSNPIRLIGAALITALLLSAPSLRSQAQAQAQAQAQIDRDAILHHLNSVITWYRDATTKIKPVGLPSDAIYQDNARNLASEAVRLAFQSARAEASVMSATDKTASATPAPPPFLNQRNSKTSRRPPPKSPHKLTTLKQSSTT
jgi:hypothetical protein